MESAEDEDGPAVMFYFSGPEWTGVQWVRFAVVTRYFPDHFVVDDITLRAGVPEPGTLAPLTLGLLGLGMSHRKA